MAKSYSQFTFEDIKQLGVVLEIDVLFPVLPTPIEPSSRLKQAIEFASSLHLGTEKAKSELIVTPILTELLVRNDKRITYFSGYNFDVDKTRGLKGHIDFMLTRSPKTPFISAPVFCIVEAKNGELDLGIPQCVAEMFAAQIFNKKEDANARPIIHGAVTSGKDWQFLRMENEHCRLDNAVFSLGDLPQLLGVLQAVIDF